MGPIPYTRPGPGPLRPSVLGNVAPDFEDPFPHAIRKIENWPTRARSAVALSSVGVNTATAVDVGTCRGKFSCRGGAPRISPTVSLSCDNGAAKEAYLRGGIA